MRPTVRLGWLIGIATSLGVALVIVSQGCTPTTTTNVDAAVVDAGCRSPSGCWLESCPCVRATLAECLRCDPQTQTGLVCTCDNSPTAVLPTTCTEVQTVCVGRAATPCPGAGARCLPVGHACSEPTVADEAPPQMVAVMGDAGAPALEPRCAFVDDVCCPGAVVGD